MKKFTFVVIVIVISYFIYYQNIPSIVTPKRIELETIAEIQINKSYPNETQKPIETVDCKAYIESEVRLTNKRNEIIYNYLINLDLNYSKITYILEKTNLQLDLLKQERYKLKENIYSELFTHFDLASNEESVALESIIEKNEWYDIKKN